MCDQPLIFKDWFFFIIPIVFLLIFQTLFGLYFDLNLTYILKLEGAGGGGGWIEEKWPAGEDKIPPIRPNTPSHCLTHEKNIFWSLIFLLSLHNNIAFRPNTKKGQER